MYCTYRERDSKSRGDDPVVVAHGGFFQLGEEAGCIVVGHIRGADHRHQDKDRVARLQLSASVCCELHCISEVSYYSVDQIRS